MAVLAVFLREVAGLAAFSDAVFFGAVLGAAAFFAVVTFLGDASEVLLDAILCLLGVEVSESVDLWSL
jgi:hypothetical protein